MKTTDYIASVINRLPKGYVFTYNDFIDEVNKREAIIKALNRMVDAGKIIKLSKGKYYKPEITPFGPLQPDFRQIVKDQLEANGKLVGYLTGFSIYNKLGFTTQVSHVIQIGSNDIRTTFKRERYTISFIRQKNIITKDNIPLLQILDIIRTIKKIPDTTIQDSINRLLAILKAMDMQNLQRMVKLAMKYPPSSRALLGALLEQLGLMDIASPLLSSLNPITKYSLAHIESTLANSTNWYFG